MFVVHRQFVIHFQIARANAIPIEFSDYYRAIDVDIIASFSDLHTIWELSRMDRERDVCLTCDTCPLLLTFLEISGSCAISVDVQDQPIGESVLEYA
jgi:hypothetical protein